MMQGMYGLVCGSIPERGAHYGKKYIERWIHRDIRNCKYVLFVGNKRLIKRRLLDEYLDQIYSI